ncbi:MAG: DUF2304 domain-containing protein, partial [Tepidisphaeraceae bacterium]
RYAVLFLLIGFPFLILAWWPRGILWISTKLQIEPNTFMLLSLSIFLILAVFELLAIVSQQDRKITTLAQTVAILMERQQRVGIAAPARQGNAPQADERS